MASTVRRHEDSSILYPRTSCNLAALRVVDRICSTHPPCLASVTILGTRARRRQQWCSFCSRHDGIALRGAVEARARMPTKCLRSRRKPHPPLPGEGKYEGKYDPVRRTSRRGSRIENVVTLSTNIDLVGLACGNSSRPYSSAFEASPASPLPPLSSPSNLVRSSFVV